MPKRAWQYDHLAKDGCLHHAPQKTAEAADLSTACEHMRSAGAAGAQQTMQQLLAAEERADTHLQVRHTTPCLRCWKWAMMWRPCQSCQSQTSTRNSSSSGRARDRALPMDALQERYAKSVADLGAVNAKCDGLQTELAAAQSALRAAQIAAAEKQEDAQKQAASQQAAAAAALRAAKDAGEAEQRRLQVGAPLHGCDSKHLRRLALTRTCSQARFGLGDVHSRFAVCCRARSPACGRSRRTRRRAAARRWRHCRWDILHSTDCCFDLTKECEMRETVTAGFSPDGQNHVETTPHCLRGRCRKCAAGGVICRDVHCAQFLPLCFESSCQPHKPEHHCCRRRSSSCC